MDQGQGDSRRAMIKGFVSSGLKTASRGLARGQELAAQHEYGRVVRGLNKAQALTDAASTSRVLAEGTSREAVLDDHISSSSSSLRTNNTNRAGHPSRQGSLSSISTASTSSTQSSSGNGTWRTYFSAARREMRNAATHTEERCVNLPGYAVLRCKGGKQIVEVEIAGWAFRTRPVNQATRTQRIFVSMARSLAGLAKLPAAAAIKAQDGQLTDALTEEPQELPEAGISSESDPKNATFSRLLALGHLPPEATEEQIRQAIGNLEFTDEPESMFDDPPPVHDFDSNPKKIRNRSRAGSVDTQDQAHTPSLPSKLRMSSVTSVGGDGERTPTATKTSEMPRKADSAEAEHPKLPPRPSRSIGPGPVSSSASTVLATSPPRSSALRREGSGGSNTSSTSTHNGLGSAIASLNFEDTDLTHMHQNLNNRLRAFFAQKLDGRRIRISVYKVDSEEQEVDTARCMARGTVVTTVGGAFKQVISFPADMDHSLDGKSMEGVLLRIVTELLPADEDTTPDNAEARTDSTLVSITRSNVPRVISDIDDTCKHTQVLHGIRSVFRNVFTLPYDRVEVEGVGPWYRAMHKLGAPIHYVSNGPVELAEVIRDFMHSAGLPVGQIKLKEYSGGSQMVTNMWEPAGQRKRANLVDVLSHFPDSKFILIGDSGEQDLEIYSTLASEFPEQIIAIFIRDVTTPKSMATIGLRKRPSLKRLVSDQASRIARPLSSKPNSKVPGNNTDLAESATASVPPKPHIPPPKQYSETDADFLSPNNPISVTDASTTKLVTTFYRRIAQAESIIPKGISLRIFRSGHECEEEALALLSTLMPEGVQTPRPALTV